MPMVSVIMPVYNGVKHLEESLESVCTQTYTDWEILVINEFGSDDGSAELIAEYQSKDPRIKLIQNTTKLGLAESLNEGFRRAAGKYLARLDADDLAHSERFQKQVEFLEEHENVGICGTYQHHFGPETNWIHCPPENPALAKASLLFNCNICHSTLMLRKQTVIEHQLFYNNQFLAEDFELWTRAIAVTDIANLPEVLGEYRWGEDNITIAKKERLNQESGSIVAAALERTIGFTLPENQLLYFQNWKNPFDTAANRQQRNDWLNDFEQVLRGIYLKNQKVIFFEKDALLSVLAAKWRWAKYNEQWNSFPQIQEIDQIFNENYRPSFVRQLKNFCAHNKTLKSKCKALFKALLRPIWRPVRARLQGIFLEQMQILRGDIDGRIWQAERQISGVLNERIEDQFCKTEQQISTTVNEQIWKAEQQISTSMDERIWKAEQQINIITDSRIWKAEQQINETMDSRIWKAELQLNETIDGRIWKAEQTITGNIDGRIWEAEKNNSRNTKTIAIYNEILIDMMQKDERNTILILNDTFNTYHCGCTGTTLAIYNYLGVANRLISVPWEEICIPEGVIPTKLHDFTSQEFFNKWVNDNAQIIVRLKLSNWVIVNGEGSLSNYNKATLNLLYTIYIASKYFNKKTAIINYSIYYDNYVDKLDEATLEDYKEIIKLVHNQIDFSAIREPFSFKQIQALTFDRAIQAFDCLPLYIANNYKFHNLKKKDCITISGGNYLDSNFLSIVKLILLNLKIEHKELPIIFLYCDLPGAEQSDDLETFKYLQEAMPETGITLEAVSALDDWLDTIAKSALLVSGRFHHTIAAFMLDTPFIVCKSDTGKIEGALEVMNKQECLIDHKEEFLPEIKIIDLLKDENFYNTNSEAIKNKIINMAKRNFEFLNLDQKMD